MAKRNGKVGKKMPNSTANVVNCTSESFSSEEFNGGSSEVSYNSSINFNDAPGGLSNFSASSEQVLVNKVVSSNPTLNLLLSTPINGGTVAAAATKASPSNVKRQLKSSTSSSTSKQTSHSLIRPISIVSSSKNFPIHQRTLVSFVEEIRKMMHSFGDAKFPLLESAKLIESIVQYQMCLLLEEAEQVSIVRSSQAIGIEDFLFLLKSDINKLGRLIRYLKLKDIRNKLFAANSSDNSTKLSKLNLETMFNDFKDNEESNSDLFSENNTCQTQQQQTIDCENQSKRVKICQAFLLSIDTPSRTLMEIFDPETDFIDSITMNRNRRLDEFTQSMSVKDYCYYQSCRTVNFIGNSNSQNGTNGGTVKSQKFQEWILNARGTSLSKMKVNSFAWDILQYFAYETVAILVEWSLLVQEDQQRRRWDEEREDMQWQTFPAKKFLHISSPRTSSNNVERNTNIGENRFIKEVLNKTSDQVLALNSSTGSSKYQQLGKDKILSSKCITTSHIMEAMRRFATSDTFVFTRFARSSTSLITSNRRKRIFCL